MIFDLFVQFWMSLLTGLVSLFPSFTLPADLTTFGTNLGASLATINGIFPVATLGVCLGLIMACWVFIIAFRVIVFIYKLIPFKAT